MKIKQKIVKMNMNKKNCLKEQDSYVYNYQIGVILWLTVQNIMKIFVLMGI